MYVHVYYIVMDYCYLKNYIVYWCGLLHFAR
jgi:hypothetical protein